MQNLKGEVIFTIRPDYNQDIENPKTVIPDVEYKFTFDHTNGFNLTPDEIDHHYEKWLVSLGFPSSSNDN
jgi:hypothetical protein